MFVNNRRFGATFEPESHEETAVNRATREYFSKFAKPSEFVREKHDKANLKLQYRKTLEVAAALTLMLLLTAFQLGRNISLDAKPLDKIDVKIEVADIPVTEQFRRPPPPARPSVPIPTEQEDVPEDLTIATTELDLTDIPPPPAPPEEEDDAALLFVAYDEPPQIIGGMAALQKHLRYPRVAQAAGIEGMVYLKVLVGVDGRTEKAEILKAKPADMGFEESAVEAIKRVRWKPAKQRDKSIRVWVSIPVQFKLVS